MKYLAQNDRPLRQRELNQRLRVQRPLPLQLIYQNRLLK